MLHRHSFVNELLQRVDADFNMEVNEVCGYYVIALIGLTAAYYILVRNDPKLLRRVQVFLAVALAQGAIGYIQYFTGIPEILVAAHLLGATLVWITAWRIRITVTRSLIVN